MQRNSTRKLLEEIQSKNFDTTRRCNCNNASKFDCQCVYNEKYRRSVVIYKIQCKLCGMCYIENTQKKFKK